MRWTSRLAIAALLAPVGLTLAATHSPAPVAVHLAGGEPAQTPQKSGSWTRDDALIATLKRASVSEPSARSSLLRVAPGFDIPEPALRAYRFADTVMRRADPACHLDWSLLAAIGDVESDHGRYGGAMVHPDGTSTPRILGPQLDGAGDVAAISDTDDGALDEDRQWDRAVGPMQFIPSTWALVGADADGDGARNPHDVDDAALAAAVYLCAGEGDLSTTAGQEAAVYRYNHSASYVDLVLRLAAAYAEDTFMLSAPQPAVRPTPRPVDLPALQRTIEVGAHPAQSPARSLGMQGTTDTASAASGDNKHAADNQRSGAEARSSTESSSQPAAVGDRASRPATGTDGQPRDDTKDGSGDTGAGGGRNTENPSSGGTSPSGADGDGAGDGNSPDPTNEPDAGGDDGATKDPSSREGGSTDGDGTNDSPDGDGTNDSPDGDGTNDSPDGDGTNDSPDGDNAEQDSSNGASGTLTRSDGTWFVGGTAVNFGDDEYLAAEALHDFDGVDGVESNLGELETLLHSSVSVVLEGDLVHKLNDLAYRR